MLKGFKKISLLFSVVMFSFILTSAPGMQLVSAVPGQGTLLGVEAGAGSTLYTINPVTGSASNPVLIGGGGVFAITGMAKDPTTGSVFISTSAGAGDIYEINPITGAIIAGPLPTGLPLFQLGDLAFRSDGTLYAAASDGNNWGIVTINKVTGAATVLTNPTSTVGLEAIAFDANDVLYAATKSSVTGGVPGIPGDTLFTIDLTPGPTQGLETPVAPITDGGGQFHPGGVVGLEFGCDGQLYAGTSRNQLVGATPELIIINPATGVFTPAGPTGFQFSFSDLTFDNTSCLDDNGDLPVGGSFIPIDSAALLLAGVQTSAAWLLPIVISAVGIALVVVRRN